MSTFKKLLTAGELVDIMEEKADDNIQDEIFDEILDDMVACGAKWTRGFPWNGYDIYIPVFEGEALNNPILAIAVKKGEARLLTVDELIQYKDYAILNF